MTDAELLAEVRNAQADYERAAASRIAAVRAATEQRTRHLSVAAIGEAAGLTSREGVYKLLRRHPRPDAAPTRGTRA